MSRYHHESPMDFEFQNGTGPLDGRSPFAQISQNPQRFPPSSKKRTHSAFDSPTKSQRNQLASPSKPLPAPPAFNALYNTPRKPSADFDDSSAGETPRSPEQNDDSDATPDQNKLRSPSRRLEMAALPVLPGAERHSPVKERPDMDRRESWLGTQWTKAKNKLYSPGRGEIPRADHYAVTDRRIEKRRKRDVTRKESRKRRHSVSETEDDQRIASPRKTSSQSQPLPETQQAPPKEHWLSTFYTFIERHPTVPHILSFYAQLLFNIFLLLCCAYAIYSIWSAVQGDIDKKAHEAMADIMAEMAACAEQYTANRCDRATRVPAMETVCENWARCMNRDASKVGRAKVSAHTFAEIFNSFLEPISYKAMFFTFILVFGCFAISNFAFGFFRKTETSALPPQHFQGYYQPPPPPTPQRSFSGQDVGGFYAGTPWQTAPQMGFEPQPSGGYGQIDGQGSPVRRLEFR
ncbi:hypothetical protein BAUCODRAFT_26965 [Baudoinia panamericana UAMH 10762]|uniref:Brl1/Brr6 domain-containing protein n=1 Tax=Baudoinia panamericana (strain UAMH 10762) TaxID=717646 RepID=M2M8A1_BAUPA|nr:uncharacterized protein BAUCODRAFT_26965 [Baudoinia panamericana UAMH 10762]EMC92586.1 hypothetical protein BAUCODRAFT_26965 [Baudoinia panamericana UAMH 10762]